MEIATFRFTAAYRAAQEHGKSFFFFFFKKGFEIVNILLKRKKMNE